MKFLKNFTLISLLLTACIPAETKPYSLSYSYSLRSYGIALVTAVPLALVFIPYVFFTRHNAAENFVKKQEDIESYSITIKTKQPHTTTLREESFTEPDYKTVINKALDWAKTHTTSHSKIDFIPSLKLIADEKTYTLSSVNKCSLAGYSTKKTAHWKLLKRKLTARFKLPTCANNTIHATRIREGIISGFIWTTIAALTGIPFISVAALSIPFFIISSHSSAKNFVEMAEDIESYAITVKVRHLCKTIKEQSFTSPDTKLVITQALLYAQQAQTAGCGIFFEPSIKLVDSEKIYSLRRVTQQILPKDTVLHALYWHKIESKLADRLIVPTRTVISTPYQGKITFFIAALMVWIATPLGILI
jgi:hypothetical protein